MLQMNLSVRSLTNFSAQCPTNHITWGYDLGTDEDSKGAAVPSQAIMPAIQGQHKEPFTQAANPQYQPCVWSLNPA